MARIRSKIKGLNAGIFSLAPLAGALVVGLLCLLTVPISETMWSELLGISGSVQIAALTPTPSATGTETPSPTATFTHTPTPISVPGGTSLEAYKTALGFWENGAYGVRGEICVTNIGEHPTQNLTIVDQVQYKDGHKFKDVLGAALTIIPPEPLAPGQARCFSYTITFEPIPRAQYRNTASITITNHSGWLPGDPQCPGPASCAFGPQVKADFTLPSNSPTNTPASTATFTKTPKPTRTSQPSKTPSSTPGANKSAPTITFTPTWTHTSLPTHTFTPLPTDTPALTATFTSLLTNTPAFTDTLAPQPTETDTPAPTAAFTPLPTDTPPPTETLPPPPTDLPPPVETLAPTHTQSP